jgi:DNA-binding NarL/FixJ family response regulator
VTHRWSGPAPLLGAGGDHMAASLEVREGYPAGLSGRAVAVLRLVAQGRTNKDIAKHDLAG